MDLAAQTRSSHCRNHLLQTPDTFVRTSLPGLERGAAVVHISPVAGAAFTQYTAEFEAGGRLHPSEQQRFLYILEGRVDLAESTSSRSLAEGGYAYLPPGSLQTITAPARARVAVIEKPYNPLSGTAAPELCSGEEHTITSSPLMGDPDLQLRQLLPDDPSFDFAVNTMTYQPGASLSQVEIHVMEHGLLMLQGGGIYRLGDRWYPVRGGDFIWMAPFCPQWFGALGREPAKYLIYKDVNRHPL